MHFVSGPEVHIWPQIYVAYQLAPIKLGQINISNLNVFPTNQIQAMPSGRAGILIASCRYFQSLIRYAHSDSELEPTAQNTSIVLIACDLLRGDVASMTKINIHFRNRKQKSSFLQVCLHVRKTKTDDQFTRTENEDWLFNLLLAADPADISVGCFILPRSDCVWLVSWPKIIAGDVALVSDIVFQT